MKVISTALGRGNSGGGNNAVRGTADTSSSLSGDQQQRGAASVDIDNQGNPDGTSQSTSQVIPSSGGALAGKLLLYLHLRVTSRDSTTFLHGCSRGGSWAANIHMAKHHGHPIEMEFQKAAAFVAVGADLPALASIVQDLAGGAANVGQALGLGSANMLPLQTLAGSVLGGVIGSNLPLAAQNG